MRKMRIEKSLSFQDPVHKVLTLKVTEGLTYKQEEDGIRATGPLFVRGVYENDEQHKFQEILEMDVLAPKEKLSGENFYLEVGEFRGTPSDEGIDLMITINIHGLMEEEKTEASAPIPARPTPTAENIPSAEETETVSIPAEENKAVEGSDPAVMEDLFEDANNVYTSYRIIVAKPDDTYASIASRYQVGEEELRSTNANKEIQAKTLVILPYAHTAKKE